jgi:hypothetical protein
MALHGYKSVFEVGDHVITTGGRYSQYGINRLLRCIKDCRVKDFERLEDSPCFEVVAHWEFHEDDKVAHRVIWTKEEKEAIK